MDSDHASDKSQDSTFRICGTGRTQISSEKTGEVCHVFIGLDVGTSSTKVIVRTPYHGNRAFAVDFGELGLEENTHLLPTYLYEDDVGRFHLGQHNSAREYNDIKMSFMRSEHSDHEPYHRVAVWVGYITFAIRLIRGWFIEQKGDLYANFCLRWWINVGMPVEWYDASGKQDEIRRTVRAAWVLSLKDEAVSKDSATNVLRNLESHECSMNAQQVLEEVQVIPEVVAEVSGYAGSHLRQQGLHMLIDVGASTVDVCSFIIHEENDEDVYSLLQTEVRDLGPKFVDESRRKKTMNFLYHWCRRLATAPRPSSPITMTPSDYAPDIQEIEHVVANNDTSYRNECDKMIRRVVGETKKRRDPKSPVWRGRLPVFICGGGRDTTIYRECVESIDAWVRQTYGMDGLDERPLPVPDNLQMKNREESFVRMAVAWGLSDEPYNIGMMYGPSEIEDIEKEGHDQAEEPWWKKQGQFVAKEQL